MKKILFLMFVSLILVLSGCRPSINIQGDSLIQPENVITNTKNADQELNKQKNKGIKECGVMGLGDKYSPDACDRSCKQISDCQFACGCGAINREENCFDDGIIYDCTGMNTDCINNKCTIIEEKIVE